MTLAIDDYPVTLWLVDDVPARMLHDGRRWRVTDVPTPLPDVTWAIPLEPIEPLVGWRFQATDPGGLTRVFDVVRQDDGEWAVIHTWF